MKTTEISLTLVAEESVDTAEIIFKNTFKQIKYVEAESRKSLKRLKEKEIYKKDKKINDIKALVSEQLISLIIEKTGLEKEPIECLCQIGYFKKLIFCKLARNNYFEYSFFWELAHRVHSLSLEEKPCRCKKKIDIPRIQRLLREHLGFWEPKLILTPEKRLLNRITGRSEANK